MMALAAVLGPALSIALEKLAPIIIDRIIQACERGEDPCAIDWSALYGRSIAELRAQVDAQARQTEP